MSKERREKINEQSANINVPKRGKSLKKSIGAGLSDIEG